MYLSELENDMRCTLQLHDSVSSNTFDIIIWKNIDGIGFTVDKKFDATIVMLLVLDYACDIISPSAETPIAFFDVKIKHADDRWVFDNNVIGKHCDRCLWQRYDYTRPGVLDYPGSSMPTIISTYNVSKYGVGVESSERVPLNVPIVITFKSPELQRVMKVHASAVHCENVNGKYRYGCVLKTDYMSDLIDILQSDKIRKMATDEE